MQEHRLAGTEPNWAEEPTLEFPGGRLRKPQYLSPVAIEAWRRIVRQLRKRRTLTSADATLIELFCQTYERWRQACDEVREDGATLESSWVDENGVRHSKRTEHPASKIASRLENSLRQVLKELSATPATRQIAKPVAPPPSVAPEPGSVADLMQQAELLNGPEPPEEEQVSLESFDETKFS
jgi:P27 family predicted phage terminase small subunit